MKALMPPTIAGKDAVAEEANDGEPRVPRDHGGLNF
jgi:hypothetical protein